MSPIYSFTIYKKDIHVPGKVYLGVFLAFVLFFAFMFGNILFFVIVCMITFLIFLSKDREENIEVYIFDDGILYGNTSYKYSDLLSYSIINQVFELPKPFLRLTFKSPLYQDAYIDLSGEESLTPTLSDREGGSANIDMIKNAIGSNLKENKDQKISLVDEIILGFFH